MLMCGKVSAQPFNLLFQLHGFRLEVCQLVALFLDDGRGRFVGVRLLLECLPRRVPLREKSRSLKANSSMLRRPPAS
jgi:hypothetical protein